MKRMILIAGCALVLTGCESPEDQLENKMRETLASQGNVQQIEMTSQDENNMTGFAVVRRPDGQEGRLDCNAVRDPEKSGSFYNWRCVPTIDDRLIANIEESIRADISQRGTVREVEMRKQDSDRMTGFVTASDSDGTVVRLDCNATRDEDGANFSWRCDPAGEAADSGGE